MKISRRTTVRGLWVILVAALMMGSVSPALAQPEQDPTWSAVLAFFDDKEMHDLGGSYVSGLTARGGSQLDPDMSVFEISPATGFVDLAYRSRLAYTVGAADRFRMPLIRWSSSGAEPEHVYKTSQRPGVPPQLSWLTHRADEGRGLVFVMQTRGNPELVETFVEIANPFVQGAAAHLQAIKNKLLGIRAQQEQEAYDLIRFFAPKATILSIGVPPVAPRPGDSLAGCDYLTPEEAAGFYDLEQAFTGSIQELAAKNGAWYVDLQRSGSPWMNGAHGICGDDPWVYGPRLAVPPSVEDWTNPFSVLGTSLHSTLEGNDATGVDLDYTLIRVALAS